MTKSLDKRVVKPVLSQLPPQAIEAEQAVLSAILMSRESIFQVIDILKPFHFYVDNHRMIYRAALKLAEDMFDVDLITVMEQLKGDNLLESIGGVSVLAELQMKALSVAHLKTHAELVLESWRQRQLITTGTMLVQSGYDPTASSIEMLGWVGEDLDRIQQGASSRPSITDIIRGHEKSVQDRYDRGESLRGVPVYSIETLDRVTDGAYGGSLTVVAGDSASGKSSLFNTACKTLIERGLPYYCWSGEMSEEKRMDRLVASMTNINSRSIGKGRHLDSTRYPGGVKSVNDVYELIERCEPIIEAGSMNVARLISTITYLVRTRDIKYFFLDRKELFDTGSEYPDTAIASIVAKLRNLATELNVCIFLAGQLRKSFADKAGSRPTMHDIIGSSSVYQSATCVLLVYRPELYDIYEDENGRSLRGRAEIIVAKNTNGEGAVTVECNYIKEISLFTDETIELVKPADQGAWNPQISPVSINETEEIPFS